MGGSLPVFLPYVPWLLAMVALIALSGTLSCSEAALFSLTRAQRQSLGQGNPAQRLAASLLENADELLTAILFWNLLINIVYFTLVSVVGLQIQEDDGLPPTMPAVFGFGALLAIIMFGEMLPKSLGVLQPMLLATVLGVPVALAMKAILPVTPSIRFVNLLSRRLIWPHFQPEPYLETEDLERAVQLSTSDKELMEHEHAVLQNLVSLSEIRVDELMRPRTQFVAFQPPVTWTKLAQRPPRSGYLLLTDPKSEEVVSALRLEQAAHVSIGQVENFASPVCYVPWCATVSHTLERLLEQNLEVAAVVDEYGSTIGILSLRDIKDTIFNPNPSRSVRLLNRVPMEPYGVGVWRVTGIMRLGRLEKYFKVQLPPSKSHTVGGVIQECLQRVPERDDTCRWGPFEFHVVETYHQGELLAELRLTSAEKEEP